MNIGELINKENIMYTCCRCKNTFDGTPALKNACGAFCPECRPVSVGRGHSTISENCIGCGEKMTDSDRKRNGKDHSNICAECVSLRDSQLLRRIRASDWLFKYVTRAEERERPARESMIRAAKKSATEKKEPAIVESKETVETKDERDQKIRQLEEKNRDLESKISTVTNRQGWLFRAVRALGGMK
jgi:hypothetical protein